MATRLVPLLGPPTWRTWRRRLGDAAVPTKNPEQKPEQGVPPDRRGGIVSAGG
jgi:hypothetical protein